MMGFINVKTKRRGVAGLISIIAILMVFGFTMTAFLQIESKQVALVGAFSDKIEIQSMSSAEKLDIGFEECRQIAPQQFSVSFFANNTWNGNSQLDSVIFLEKQNGVIKNMTGGTYLTDLTNKTIPSHVSGLNVTVIVQQTSTNPDPSIRDSTHATFVTKLGNQFTTQGDFQCP